MKTTPDFSALLNELNDPDWKVRCKAAEALGKARHRPAVEPLIEHLLSDKSQTVRSRAAMALGRIKDPRAIEPLLEAVDKCVKYATNGLMKFGPAAVPALAARLADRSRTYVSRSVTVRLLADIGNDAARSAIVAAAWDDDVMVRWHVAEALGKCGADEDSFSALLFLLRDPVPMVSGAAAQSLGQLRDERAIEIIVHMFHGDTPFEQEFHYFNAATNVLREWAGVRGKAFHEIEPYLRDVKPIVRIAAALSLVWLRDKRALQPLGKATQDADPLVRHAAEWALQSTETLLSYNVPIPPLVSSMLLR